MKNRFDWLDFIRKVAVIAIPVALQNLLTTTGSMVDTMMIASIGKTQVGAVGLCAQFSSLMFSGYWGFVGGGMLFFSQFYGAGDDEGIKKSYGLTVSCMMSVGLLFCVLATCFPGFIMSLYTDKESIREVGISYLKIAGFSYPFTVLSSAMAALLRCTDRVKIPLYGAVASVATNIFLNWVFIFGNLGVAPMGVRGAALATVIAQAVSVAVIGVLAIKSRHKYIFAFRGHFKWDRELFSSYFKKCSPIIANEVFLGLGNMGINVVLGRQPEEAIAAVAVFRTLEGLVIGFFAGFSNASSVLVGTQVGAGNIDTAFKRAWRLVYMCQGVIGTVVAGLVLFHKPILTVMGMSGDSFGIAFGFLCIYAVAALIRMGNWTMNDTYRAAGDAAYGTILEIVFMWLMVLPAVWLGGMVLKLPTLIVFALCYIDEIIRYVMMQVHLWNGKWIKPVTPEGKKGLTEWNVKKLSKNIK
ncbi:MAG: MATE family efflux transporter [Lachnospiraceae bacterium]|nr:MATE family efflux transporter [Lachnospiraceae bacterium]